MGVTGLAFLLDSSTSGNQLDFSFSKTMGNGIR